MLKKFRYAFNPRGVRRSIHLRRFRDPIQHEKYYAFLKHRAQARYRGEPYRLTWAQWQRLWPHRLWQRRGRGAHSVRLTQIDATLGWSVQNCRIRSHHAHMREVNQARRQHTETTEA